MVNSHGASCETSIGYEEICKSGVPLWPKSVAKLMAHQFLNVSWDSSIFSKLTGHDPGSCEVGLKQVERLKVVGVYIFRISTHYWSEMV